MLVHGFHYIKKHKTLLFLIVPAFFLHMLVMMPSGTSMCFFGKCGIHFWGVNSFDGMWHLEIAAVAFNQFPFIVPTYAGALLSGYNILMDFVLFLLSKIGISPIFALFKIIPPVWFICYTAVIIALSRKIKDSPLFVGCVLFFVYFAGHFGYILQLYRERSIFLGSQSFALQSANILLNTQLALSLPAMLGILIIILQKKWDLKSALYLGLLTSLVFGLKFYGGVVSLFLVGLYLLEGLWRKKQILLTLQQGFIIGTLIVITIILFYNPFQASSSGSIFIFAPFSTVHSMIEEPNMVYLQDMVNARYFLYENAPYSPRLLYIELLSSAIFIVLNFGTRIFGIFYIFIKLILRKSTRLELYILLGTIIATTLTILLIQKGDWWNTVQFSYYGIFLSSFLTAFLLYDLLKQKKIFFTIIASVLILLTLPSNLRILRDSSSVKTIYIPQEEFTALQKLKEQPNGVVFTSFDFPENSGYPFMSYENTGYVSVFTHKQTYLGHFGPLTIIGVGYKPRYERVKKQDCTMFNEVQYIYYLKKQKKDLFKKCNIGGKFQLIYADSAAMIFKKK